MYAESTSHIALTASNAAASAPAILALATGGSTAVLGYSGSSNTLPAWPASTGVFGAANKDATSFGVMGSSAAGTGIAGRSTSGTAGSFSVAASGGFALRTAGRIAIGKVSGVATNAAGRTASPPIATGTDVVPGSYVLLSPQADPGARRIWVAIDTGANTVTIRTNATSTKSLRVAWLLVG
jgi:hypothetical protein